jgi:hypothetical protein
MTLDEWYEQTKGALRKAAHVCAADALVWAQNLKSGEDRWTDRTKTAIQELDAYVVYSDEGIGFGVTQGVDYGKYLETVSDGKYAVCEKAVTHFIPDFSAMIEDILKKRPNS